MFQKEVANRLVAKPCSKHYSLLSVLTQFSCRIKHLFDISPKSFYPTPKITSSLINLTTDMNLLNSRMSTYDNFKKILKVAFNQRRKMLRISLKYITPNITELLKKTEIHSTSRPEELTVEKFDSLISKISKELYQI